ncbi:hypothetical protein POTOM_058177 [Populus tomentosa]|uniref:Uncharacterized protein n=1 Tax=Populus tomentosa TaxID=118781 RepID=A0A8X7XXA2_POPTO|nr:hypothetical protein POTOM_058177 [Populus tomentosa]
MPLEPLLNPYITLRGPADNLKSHHGGNIIESCQEVAGKGSCPINVKVMKQVTDPKHSAGKVITSDLIQQLLQKVTDGDSNAIPVLFTDRDAQMQGLCFTKCSQHGTFGHQLVFAFARALAEAVTNPYATAFFQDSSNNANKTIEAASACWGIFGSGALDGYTGKVRVDPNSGGGFNGRGSRGRKFLIPAVWHPKTSKQCTKGRGRINLFA